MSNRVEEIELSERVQQAIIDARPEKGKIIGAREGEPSKYLLAKPMKPRHKLIAGMKALGMTNSKISDELGRAKNGQGTHTSLVCKDPLLKAEIERQRELIMGTARQTLTSVVERAATNFKDKVEAGDMKASEKILEFAGIFKKETTNINANINMDFGTWLSSAQTENPLLIGDSSTEQARIITDVDDIPDEELNNQGVRLTDNLERSESLSDSPNEDSSITSNSDSPEVAGVKGREVSIIEEIFGGGIKGTIG